jgi:TIR domain
MPLSDAGRPETVSAFLSHKYDAPDVNLFFFDLISTVALIAFRVDLGKYRTSTTRLERMIRDADAFFGVWPLPGDPRADWDSADLASESQYFRLELDMAIRARKPGVVFFDRRYGRRLQTPPELHALPYDAQDVKFSTAAPGWRRLKARISQASADLAPRLDARIADPSLSGENIGLVLPQNDDAEVVRDVLHQRDLTVSELPLHLTASSLRLLRGCDFVVIDIGDLAAQVMATFLHGQFIPLLRVRRDIPDPPISQMEAVLFGDLEVGYRRDVVRWSTEQELRERLDERLTVIDRQPELIGDASAASRYFSSAAKRKEPVFLSYSSADAGIAGQVADELRRLFQEVFDYRARASIPAGEFWQDHVSGELSSTAVGVILFSESYANSGHCMDEPRHLYDRKIENEAKLLPVRLDDSPASSLLARLEYRRLGEWGGPAELISAWLKQLDP